jgi:putative ABC transport system permease protein
MPVLIVAVVAVAVSLPILGIAIAQPGLRQLAWRGSVRRPMQTLLVLSGVIVATAIVTSAGGIGDSWRASVRQSAFTQLGPVDEEILARGLVGNRITAAVGRARLAGLDGLLPMVALNTTVRGRDFVARVARAQVLEADFAQAARFGGDPSTTGIDGPTPTGDQAVMTADLSDSIAILPGHRVTIYAYGQSRTLRITRVLPRLGIAGLAAVTGPVRSTSLNLFVPPGTIAAMLRAGNAEQHAQPVSILAVSNTGGVLNDRSRADAVTAALRTATQGIDGEVVPVKQHVLADADARSRHFTDLFRAFGILSALSGILLLVLTFLVLTRDRVRSMAILRAQGLRRGGVVGALSLEGWGYALFGTALGAPLGIGLTALVVVLARDFAALETGGGTDLVVSVRASSIAVGWLIGLVASLAVMVSAAVVAARSNIAQVMRGAPDATFASNLTELAWAGGAVSIAGVALTTVGLVAGNLAASVVAPAIGAAGIAALLYSPRRARVIVSIFAVVVFAWSLVAVSVVGDRVTSAAAIVAEGIVLSTAALAFAAANRSWGARLLGGRGRRGLPVELGFAYADSERRRTTLMSATYAGVLFTLALLVTIAHMYENDVDDAAHRLGGGSMVEITSNPENPVPVADVRNSDGVAEVAETAAASLRLDTKANPIAVPEEVVGVGFDNSFIGNGSPPLAARGAGMASDEAVYRLVAGDPTKVILGRDLDTDVVSGFPGGRPHVGDVVNVRDLATGTTRSLTVAGIAKTTRYNGVAHIYLSRSAVDGLVGGPAAANLLFVRTTPGTNDDTLAAIIDGTHLPNGAYARSFVRLARETLDAQQQFLNVAAGYAAVGLVAALIGIGVLMTDRVRERRGEIAMLRALGFRSRTIGRAFRVETLAIALEGTLLGAISGLLLANRLGTSGGLGAPLSFTVPLVQLLVIIAAVLATSLFAASIAARRAARLRPARALRND